jgi:uncharacterized repeat protein (TIGR01451 family)
MNPVQLIKTFLTRSAFDDRGKQAFVPITAQRTWVFTMALIIQGMVVGQAMAAPGVPPFTGTQCPADRYGSKLVCTANDVRFGGITAGAGAPTSCVAGSDINLNVNATVTSGSAQRYNIGIFFGNDGKDIQRLSSTGGNASCSTYTFPLSPSPLGDLDGNACGDTTAAGTATVPLTNVTLQCAPGPDGKLLVPALVSWQQAPAACVSGDTYPVPGTTSKCNASTSSSLTTVQTYAKLTIVKKTTSGNDTFEYSTAGSSGTVYDSTATTAIPTFNLTTSSGQSPAQVLSVPYAAGPSASIKVTELVEANWAMLGVECWTNSSKTTLATNVVPFAATSGNEGGLTANFNAVDQEAYCEITNSPYSTGQAALELIKTHSGTFTPGATFLNDGTSYTVTLKNVGNGPENNPQIVDVIPAGMTVTGYTTGGNTSLTCSPIPLTGNGTSTITCSRNGNFSGGDTASVTFRVSIDQAASGLKVNTVTATAGSLTATATDEVRLPARPTVSKTVSPAEITSGGASTLTITLGNPNAFPITLTSAFVDDLIGSGMSIPNTSQYDTNCPVAPVIASASVTYPSGAWIPAEGCVINVTITATSTGTNTISASALQTDAGTNVNSATATLTIVPPLTAPGLTKSFMTSPVAPGGVTELRVTLSNSNATPLVLNEDLTDLMPTGLTLASDPTVSATYSLRYGTCDSNYVMASSGTTTAGAQLMYTAGGSIPANGSCYVAVRVVASASSAATSYTNLIPANALQTQGGTYTQSATAVLTVASPDMAVNISGLPVGGADNATYSGTYTCTNIGGATATAGTSCAISGLPTGVTMTGCTLNSSAWNAGDSVPVGGVVTCNVSGTNPTAGTYSVIGSTGATGDNNTSNNTATQSVTIANGSNPVADMAANIANMPATATAGTSYAGSYTCSNVGLATATSASCAISGLPAGVTMTGCTLNGSPWNAVADVIAGGVVTCQVSGTPTVGGPFTLTATTGATNDNNTANNSASMTLTVTGAADMSVSLTGIPNTATIGATYNGSFTCTNVGNVSATAGTSCAITGLPAGVTVGTCTLTPGSTNWVAGNTVPVGGVVTCTVAGTPTTAGSVTVTATTGATGDTNAANNTASKSVAVSAPDMAVNITGIPSTATAGIPYSGSYTCSNIGNADATSGTSCAITGLPVGVTMGTCTLTPGSTSWSAGNVVPAGGVVTCSLSGTPTTAGSVTVTATTGATGDTNVGNNSANKSVNVGQVADLSVLKNAPALVGPSGEITYTVTISNAGASGANGAVFADATPAGMTNFAWTCDLATGGALCPNASGSTAINETIAIFPAGSSLTYTITGTAPAMGSVTNTATLTAPSGVVDPDPSNNSDTTTTALSQTPLPATADVSVTKYGPTSVAPNSPLTFKLLVANAGYVAANGSRLTDAVPAGLTNVTWTCQGAAGGAVCPNASGSNAISETIATFPAGSSLTYLVTGTAGGSGTINNQVSLIPPVGVNDPDPSNNNDSSLSMVEAITGYADLSVAKIGPASVVNGQSVSYQLLVANAGTSPVTGARVVDRLPSGLTNVTWTCANAAGSTGGSCQSGSTSGTGDVNALVDLSVAARVSIVVTATAPATGPATFANVAEVFAPQGIADPRPDNNLSSAVITQLLIQPVANDDYFETVVNIPLNASVVPNDSILSGSTFSVVTNPSHGTVSLDPATGAFTYNPTTNYAGIDTFTYQICLPAPNQSVCDSAAVNIAIYNVDGGNNGSTSTAGNPNLLNVLGSVTFNGQPLPPQQANIQSFGNWPAGITLNNQTGQVGVAPGTPPGNYQVQAMVCKNMPVNSSLARVSTVGDLTQNGQCCLVTLDIVVTATPTPPPPPRPIPTMSEWGRLVLALMLLGLAWQNRRVMFKR